MKTKYQINGREIASGCPVYIIAELSANYNQNFNQTTAHRCVLQKINYMLSDLDSHFILL